jgi:hypothetical protein
LGSAVLTLNTYYTMRAEPHHHRGLPRAAGTRQSMPSNSIDNTPA